MKNLMLLFLFVCVLSANAQKKQHEITDFKEKWELDVLDIKKLEINSLAGDLNIIGGNTLELKIRVSGPDTYKLTGGATDLGFILSKNKRGEYRIQGIVSNSKNFDVIYEIQVPNNIKLKIQSGSRFLDDSTWSISKMDFLPMKLEKIKGRILIDGVQKPLAKSNWNFNIKNQ